MNDLLVNRNISILIVDDTPAMRKIIKNCLKQLGFGNITEATDGSSAVAQIEQSKFDLVISEHQMPDMSSFELLNQIRNSSSNNTLPCVVVAASTERPQVKGLETMPKTAVVMKPFTYDILNQKLSALFKDMS